MAKKNYVSVDLDFLENSIANLKNINILGLITADQGDSYAFNGSPQEVATSADHIIATEDSVWIKTDTRTANTVLAGPASGNNAAATFRSLVAADIPSIPSSKISDLSSVLSSYLPLAGGTMTGAINWANNASIVGTSGNLLIQSNQSAGMIVFSSDNDLYHRISVDDETDPYYVYKVLDTHNTILSKSNNVLTITLPDATGTATSYTAVDGNYVSGALSTALADYTPTANFAKLTVYSGNGVGDTNVLEYTPTGAANLYIEYDKNGAVELTANGTTHKITVNHKTQGPSTSSNTTISDSTGKVLSAITVNKFGHVTSVAQKTLAAADIPNIAISQVTNLQTSLDGKADDSDLLNYLPLAGGEMGVGADITWETTGTTVGEFDEGNDTYFQVSSTENLYLESTSGSIYLNTDGQEIHLSAADIYHGSNHILDTGNLPELWGNTIQSNLAAINGPLKFAPVTTASTTAHLEVITINVNGTPTQFLHTRLPFYSDGDITAFGANGTSGGGGGDGKIQTVYTTSDFGTIGNSHQAYETETFNAYAVDTLYNRLVTAEGDIDSLETAVGSLVGFEARVVNSLPPTGDVGIIYLVSHNHGTGDVYDEYIWVSSASSFEKIGNTDIDLSQYINSVDFASGSSAGTGKAITNFTKSNNSLTFTTGTFLTSHQSLDGYVNELVNTGSGTGKYVSNITKSGKTLTLSFGTLPTDYWKTGDSRTKNTVLAAPSNANGVASFRALVQDDIPTLYISKISGLQSALDDKLEGEDLDGYVNALSGSTSGGQYVSSISKSGKTITVTYTNLSSVVSFGTDGTTSRSITIGQTTDTFLKGITSSDVIGALEYTPVNPSDIKSLKIYGGANGTTSDTKVIEYSPSTAKTLYITKGNAGISVSGDATNTKISISHATGGANKTITAANKKVLSAITVDTYGHVTSVSSKDLAAADIPDLSATYLTVAAASSGYQPLDSDLTAIAGITSGTGLLKRTQNGSTVTWSIDTNSYVTSSGVTSITAGTGLSGGTITSTGTISISSTYQTYISNGNTAYGWGNHASAGYMDSLIPNGSGNYVTGISFDAGDLTVSYGTLPTTIALANVTDADDLKLIEALTGTGTPTRSVSGSTVTWSLESYQPYSGMLVSFAALGNNSNAGLIHKDSTGNLTMKSTSSIASFGTEGDDYITISLNGTSKNVLTQHKDLSAYLQKSELNIIDAGTGEYISGLSWDSSSAALSVSRGSLSGYLTTSAAASTYQPLDADLTAIAGLTGTSGLLKKTAANTWSLDTNTYLTTTSASNTYLPLTGGTLTGPLHVKATKNNATTGSDGYIDFTDGGSTSYGRIGQATSGLLGIYASGNIVLRPNDTAGTLSTSYGVSISPTSLTYNGEDIIKEKRLAFNETKTGYFKVTFNNGNYNWFTWLNVKYGYSNTTAGSYSCGTTTFDVRGFHPTGKMGWQYLTAYGTSGNANCDVIYGYDSQHVPWFAIALDAVPFPSILISTCAGRFGLEDVSVEFVTSLTGTTQGTSHAYSLLSYGATGYLPRRTHDYTNGNLFTTEFTITGSTTRFINIKVEGRRNVADTHPILTLVHCYWNGANFSIYSAENLGFPLESITIGRMAETNYFFVWIAGGSNRTYYVTISEVAYLYQRNLVTGSSDAALPEDAATTLTITPKDAFLRVDSSGRVEDILTIQSATTGSPSLWFRRGTISDSYVDWRIMSSGGGLYFDYSASGTNTSVACMGRATVSSVIHPYLRILGPASDGSEVPELVLVRGTTSDSYTDWKIQNDGGYLKFTNSSSGTDTERMQLSGIGLYPCTTSGLSLGLSTKEWSNIYSAAATISGDATIGGNETVTGTLTVGASGDLTSSYIYTPLTLGGDLYTSRNIYITDSTRKIEFYGNAGNGSISYDGTTATLKTSKLNVTGNFSVGSSGTPVTSIDLYGPTNIHGDLTTEDVYVPYGKSIKFAKNGSGYVTMSCDNGGNLYVDGNLVASGDVAGFGSASSGATQLANVVYLTSESQMPATPDANTIYLILES